MREDFLVEYDLYLWSIYDRKYDYQHPKRDELLKIFNISQEEADKIKKRYIRSLLKKYREQKKRWWAIYYSHESSIDKLFALEQIKEVDKDINKLNYIGKKVPSSMELGTLKTIPIPKLLDQWGIEIKNNFFRLRPDDKTPSCKYYPETNSFYDFGASIGGSIIDLYMAKEECSLSSAIKNLTNLFSVLY